jgi:hypothetical protein
LPDANPSRIFNVSLWEPKFFQERYCCEQSGRTGAGPTLHCASRSFHIENTPARPFHRKNASLGQVPCRYAANCRAIPLSNLPPLQTPSGRSEDVLAQSDVLCAGRFLSRGTTITARTAIGRPIGPSGGFPNASTTESEPSATLCRASLPSIPFQAVERADKQPITAEARLRRRPTPLPIGGDRRRCRDRRQVVRSSRGANRAALEHRRASLTTSQRMLADKIKRNLMGYPVRLWLKQFKLAFCRPFLK